MLNYMLLNLFSRSEVAASAATAWQKFVKKSTIIRYSSHVIYPLPNRPALLHGTSLVRSDRSSILVVRLLTFLGLFEAGTSRRTTKLGPASPRS